MADLLYVLIPVAATAALILLLWQARRPVGAGYAAAPRSVQRLVSEAASDAVVVLDGESRILYANPAAFAVLGYRPEELVGQELGRIVPDDLRDLHRDSLRAHLRSGARPPASERIELPGQRADGQVRALEIAFGESREGDLERPVFVAVIRDVTAQRRTLDMLRLRCDVTAALAADAPVAEITPHIIRAACDNAGWDAGELWSVDDAVGVLRLDSAWSGASSVANALLIDARRLVLRPGRGLPGRAWHEGRVVWALDALTDPDFRRGDAARATALKGAFAVPLRAAGKVVAVLTFYARRAMQPDETLLATLDALAGTIGEAYQRLRGDALLREHSLRLRVLADVSLELSEAHPDLHLTYEAAVRNTAQRVGDLCLLLMQREDGATFDLAAYHHRDPHAVLLADELRGAVTRLLDRTPAGRIIRSGRPLFMPVVTPEQIRATVHADFWPQVERVGLHSLVVVPLKARGRPVGAILVARDEAGRPYTSDDVLFLQQLAGRVALAIVNAQDCSCALILPDSPAAAAPSSIRILAG